VALSSGGRILVARAPLFLKRRTPSKGFDGGEGV